MCSPTHQAESAR